MSKNKYIVFIPKYEFDIENGKAIKRLSEGSLSIRVESDNIQEATFKVLKDFKKDQLYNAGFCVDEIKVTEDFGEAPQMQVYIKGVKKNDSRR